MTAGRRALHRPHDAQRAGQRAGADALWDGPTPIPHTRLGQSADLVVVVPATARIIGAYAHGLSTDLLTNTLLATRAPVLVCPAMHTEMWEHPAVVDNIATLRRRGVHIVEPGVGSPRRRRRRGRAARRAGRHRRRGRAHRCGAGRSRGLRVVVSAGGTREPIDAVRVIANRSSGKQGYAIAAEAAARGADVTLVSTVDLPTRPASTVEPSRRPPRWRRAMAPPRRRRRRRDGRRRRRLPAQGPGRRAS